MLLISSRKLRGESDARKDFAMKAMRKGLPGVLCETVEEAVEKALKSADKDDLIFIGGSTFIVADALPLFMKEDEYK